MRFRDLNFDHLGKTITITRDADSITGTLTSVRHQATVAESTRLCSPEPEYMIGGKTTTIRILGWGERDYTPEAECTIDSEAE